MALKANRLTTALIGLRLDGLHVGVGKPEMVADFVDQDMADDVAERLLVLGPVIQDRAGDRARPCWAAGRCRRCCGTAVRRPETGRAGRIRSPPAFPPAPRRSGNRRRAGSRPRTGRENPGAGARRSRAPWLPSRPASALLLFSTSRLFSAGSPAGATGFAGVMELTSARQSETLRPPTGLGGRDDTDCDGGMTGCFGRALAARSGRAGANRVSGDQDRAGGADRYVGAAPPRDQARAGLSARAMATGRLPPLQPRAQGGAGLHRDLCAGIPAERHRDHAPHALLLAARLKPVRACWSVGRNP